MMIRRRAILFAICKGGTAIDEGGVVVPVMVAPFTFYLDQFIFVSAAKYCVDIAIHQHGCCVLQRCISHSTGELREKLIAEISANGLLLAQDAYGNYVVQFILELRIPSALSKLTYQFEGNYVNLSRQKFSSHVVEKCLAVCNNEDDLSAQLRSLKKCMKEAEEEQYRVIKVLMQISRRNSWAEIVHSNLICMMTNMFYQVPEGRDKIGSATPLFLVDQVDLIGGIEVIFGERKLAQRSDRVKSVDLHPTEPWWFCDEGLSNRRTSATRVNAESFRSHSVFTCVVESRSKSAADGLTR
ncbi:hypothetical protein ACS0TY_019011 [Phlomoides rotata]